MEQTNKTKRLAEIDIMRGLLIILMVMGHCGFPFTHWIFLFHMAAFFAISGFLFKRERFTSASEYGSFLLKRIRDLYLPYVLINLLFLLLNNFFVKINIYSDNPLFETATGQPLTQYLDTAAFFKKLLGIAFLYGELPQLSGSTWFFGVLFILLVVHGTLCFCIGKIKSNVLKIVISLLIVIGSLAFLIVFKYGSLVLPGQLFFLRIDIAYLCFIIGVLFRFINKTLSKYRNGSKREYVIISVIALVSFGLLVFLNNYNDISIANASITSIYGLVLCSTLGFLLVYSVSLLLSKLFITEMVFAFVGRHTRSIVMLHMVCFKIVTLLLIIIYAKEMYYLASFPILDSVGCYVWIPYLFIGVSVPLLFSILWWKLSQIVQRLWEKNRIGGKK